MPWKRGVYTAEPTHHLHITSTPPGTGPCRVSWGLLNAMYFEGYQIWILRVTIVGYRTAKMRPDWSRTCKNQPVVWFSYLPLSKRRSFTKLRVSSHRLAIETGRYTRPITPRSQRFCNHCTHSLWCRPGPDFVWGPVWYIKAIAYAIFHQMGQTSSCNCCRQYVWLQIS